MLRNSLVHQSRTSTCNLWGSIKRETAAHGTNQHKVNISPPPTPHTAPTCLVPISHNHKKNRITPGGYEASTLLPPTPPKEHVVHNVSAKGTESAFQQWGEEKKRKRGIKNRNQVSQITGGTGSTEQGIAQEEFDVRANCSAEQIRKSSSAAGLRGNQ